MAIAAKDREMELLEDNHRVELRVYQQKVKHLEYEHRNSIKTIIEDGTNLLEKEQVSGGSSLSRIMHLSKPVSSYNR